MRAWPLAFVAAATMGCSFPDYVASDTPDVGGLAGEFPSFDASVGFDGGKSDAPTGHDTNPEAYEYADGACIFPNDCGGCVPIGHTPDEACGACGKYVCATGGNDITCVDPGRNACGGCAALDAAPGDACGDCGKWVCASDGESIACNDPGKNACGGCEVLGNKPGDSCASCGGTYQCNGTALQCSGGSSLNACGGCSTLANPPGGKCGVCGSGKFACNGPEATVCNDPVTTPAPGTACGTCKTLKYACSADGLSTACPSPDDANACGGCGVLPGDPGDDCGICGYYVCTTAHTMTCRSPPKCLAQP